MSGHWNIAFVSPDYRERLAALPPTLPILGRTPGRSSARAALVIAALLFSTGFSDAGATKPIAPDDSQNVDPLPSVDDVERALMVLTGETLMSMNHVSCRESFSDDEVTSFYCTYIVGHQDALVMQSESDVFYRAKKPQHSRLIACAKDDIDKIDRCSTALPI